MRTELKIVSRCEPRMRVINSKVTFVARTDAASLSQSAKLDGDKCWPRRWMRARWNAKRRNTRVGQIIVRVLVRNVTKQVTERVNGDIFFSFFFSSFPNGITHTPFHLPGASRCTGLLATRNLQLLRLIFCRCSFGEEFHTRDACECADRAEAVWTQGWMQTRLSSRSSGS